MCQIKTTTASIVDRYMTNANEAAIAKAAAIAPTRAPADEDSLMKTKGMRILICSESVPPQVNGIARRIGMYADGLRSMGCNVGKLIMVHDKLLPTLYMLCLHIID
jgi:hypothetical protein